jgi:hypothetical protein
LIEELSFSRLTSGTLDDTLRLGEDGSSLSLELLNKLPCFFAVFVGIDSRHIRLEWVLQSSTQPLDVLEV